MSQFTGFERKAQQMSEGERLLLLKAAAAGTLSVEEVVSKVHDSTGAAAAVAVAAPIPGDKTVVEAIVDSDTSQGWPRWLTPQMVQHEVNDAIRRAGLQEKRIADLEAQLRETREQLLRESEAKAAEHSRGDSFENANMLLRTQLQSRVVVQEQQRLQNARLLRQLQEAEFQAECSTTRADALEAAAAEAKSTASSLQRQLQAATELQATLAEQGWTLDGLSSEARSEVLMKAVTSLTKTDLLTQMRNVGMDDYDPSVEVEAFVEQVVASAMSGAALRDIAETVMQSGTVVPAMCSAAEAGVLGAALQAKQRDGRLEQMLVRAASPDNIQLANECLQIGILLAGTPQDAWAETLRGDDVRAALRKLTGLVGLGPTARSFFGSEGLATAVEKLQTVSNDGTIQRAADMLSQYASNGSLKSGVEMMAMMSGDDTMMQAANLIGDVEKMYQSAKESAATVVNEAAVGPAGVHGGGGAAAPEIAPTAAPAPAPAPAPAEVSTKATVASEVAVPGDAPLAGAAAGDSAAGECDIPAAEAPPRPGSPAKTIASSGGLSLPRLVPSGAADIEPPGPALD